MNGLLQQVFLQIKKHFKNVKEVGREAAFHFFRLVNYFL